MKNILKNFFYPIGCNRDYKNNYDINMNELNKLIKQGATLVDVRSPQEYKEGHLKNAILIPEYEISLLAKKYLPNKYRTIVVYCGTGKRSKRAVLELKRLGFYNVYNLYKGLENY